MCSAQDRLFYSITRSSAFEGRGGLVIHMRSTLRHWVEKHAEGAGRGNYAPTLCKVGPTLRALCPSHTGASQPHACRHTVFGRRQRWSESGTAKSGRYTIKVPPWQNSSTPSPKLAFLLLTRTRPCRLVYAADHLVWIAFDPIDTLQGATCLVYDPALAASRFQSVSASPQHAEHLPLWSTAPPISAKSGHAPRWTIDFSCFADLISMAFSLADSLRYVDVRSAWPQESSSVSSGYRTSTYIWLLETRQSTRIYHNTSNCITISFQAFQKPSNHEHGEERIEGHWPGSRCSPAERQYTLV